MRRAPALALLLALTATAPPARARARLAVDYHVTLAGCPPRSSFLDRLRGRLGHDPVDSAAPTIAVVSVVARGSRLVGDVELRQRRAAAALGKRTIVVSAGECDALISALAATLAHAVDRIEPARRPPPASRPAGSPAARPYQRPDRELPGLAAPPRRGRLFAAVGGRAGGWRFPGVALGPAIRLGARWRRWRLAASGSLLLSPGRATVGSGHAVSGLVATGGVVGCFAPGALRLCPTVELGALQARADARLGARFVAYGGLETGLGIRLSPSWSLELVAALSVALVRTNLQIGEETVWTAAPLTASIGFDVHYAFL